MTRRDLPPRVPVTALRVFEPLEAFPAEQQRLLAALTVDPGAARGAEEAERRLAWRGVLGRPLRRPEIPARALTVDGTVLLSPVATSPGPDGQNATAGPGGQRATDPGAASTVDPVPPRRHVLVRAWELPVAWLVIVRAQDLAEGTRTARYRLPLTRAQERARVALATLRAEVGDLEVTADVEGLVQWLVRFHPRAWVEVDARPVAALVGGEDGADDVRWGLESLAAGDMASLAAAYRRLTRRSRTLDQLSQSS